ncbi:MAG: ribosome-associated translation inhibitor RaiA, partial [Nanoarchaeota archaeon]
RFIVVGNKTDVKGYVRREDFIENHLDLFEDRKVKDYYNKDLITIKDTDPISKALHIMKFNNIDRLVVVDDDENLVGIVTITDILKEVFKPMEKLEKGAIAPEKIHELRKPVMEIMSDNPIVIRPSMKLTEAFDLMKRNNINSLIVVKENDPTTALGLITMFDLLLLLNRFLNQEEGIDYQIALQNVVLDEFDKEYIKQKLQKIMRKYEKMIERASIFIDIKKYKEKLEDYHETDFYHVKIHLTAPKLKIIVEAKDDALYTALNKAIKKLDKQLLKYKEEFSEKEVMELLKELAERF